ncbi:hypothetical protein BU24DRAFT_267990 [Aaosphaeria arxii CBS 175.79]|uniref:Cell wall protein n=1 Tax=Aaosphaeria arxii CBS 175.79 TaxID=1450172 RepID=A0A6A5XGH8_9PLEO|nr:uncharacterized protein BU24DRAFT_267990 [Aaosphaeria arxii CBS 175.79]KAF2012033.1 hypothetical protein BU24DRAFT_267990 [Aaosphaeria arxii CBS 175.79]
MYIKRPSGCLSVNASFLTTEKSRSLYLLLTASSAPYTTIMHSSIFLALAAVASATPQALEALALYPVAQVLPVPGYNNAPDGFNSLATLYSNSASQLSARADSIAGTNAVISSTGAVQASYDVKNNLTSTLLAVNNLFWQTTYDTEKKICSIITSINQQNVDGVRGNLRTGISAEVQAIIKITRTLLATVRAINAQATLFVEAEKAIVATLIQAIVTAATASVEPAGRLSAGLTSVGITGISDVVQTFQSAVASLQTAATITWETE